MTVDDRGELVAAVEAELGVEVRAAGPVTGGDINDAWRFETTAHGALFVKTRSDAPHGFYAAEAAGLEWLGEADALTVPDVVGVGDGEVRFLALSWVDSALPAVDHDEVLGRGLARLHLAGADSFGLRGGGFAGSLQLPNTPCDTWSEFYATCRLEPLVALCADAGVLPASTVARVEAVIGRLDALVGPFERPARLHGDLWAGNVMTGAGGHPVLVDPAAYGGHREVDLAMMRLFGGFSPAVFDAYDEAWPLAADARRRVPLWQLAPLLVHARLFSGGYGASVDAAARACL
ncbi:MAG: fructosamine kinase family protein [Acidimicrobiales bacterium]